MNSKKKIKVAIDSPAAAGAGTQAKLIANLKIKKPKKFTYLYLKKK